MEIKLAGYGTYITGMALIMWAIGGYIAGKVDITIAIPELLAGIGAIRMRMGMEKITAAKE